MGDATATEAAINTTLHPTSTSAEHNILQAPSAGSAVHFFFHARQGHQLCHPSTLVVPGCELCQCIEDHCCCIHGLLLMSSVRARARVYTAACAACCRWVANTEHTVKLKCTQKPHMRAPASFTHESCRNGKSKAVAALCCFGK